METCKFDERAKARKWEEMMMCQVREEKGRQNNWQQKKKRYYCEFE